MFKQSYALVNKAFSYKKIWYWGYVVAVFASAFLADSFFKFLVSALAVGYIELMTRSYINFDIPPIQSALASPSLSEEGKEIFQYVFGLLAYVFHMALAVYLYLGALGLIEF